MEEVVAPIVSEIPGYMKMKLKKDTTLSLVLNIVVSTSPLVRLQIMGDQNYPRRPSLAQCDYLKFRRGFESIAGSDKHTVTGKVLGTVAERVGYNIPGKQIKVRLYKGSRFQI